MTGLETDKCGFGQGMQYRDSAQTPASLLAWPESIYQTFLAGLTRLLVTHSVVPWEQRKRLWP